MRRQIHRIKRGFCKFHSNKLGVSNIPNSAIANKTSNLLQPAACHGDRDLSNTELNEIEVITNVLNFALPENLDIFLKIEVE